MDDGRWTMDDGRWAMGEPLRVLPVTVQSLGAQSQGVYRKKKFLSGEPTSHEE
jgi:hypothetical protein